MRTSETLPLFTYIDTSHNEVVTQAIAFLCVVTSASGFPRFALSSFSLTIAAGANTFIMSTVSIIARAHQC